MNAMQIIAQVAEQRGVTVSDIKGASEQRVVVEARIEIVARLVAERGLTNGQMQRMLNKSEWAIRYYRSPEFRQSQIRKLKLRNRVAA